MRKITIYILLMISVVAFAQNERSMARKGNRFFADSAYTESEVAYMRALDKDPELKEAQFNLTSSAIRQGKFDEAIEQLEIIASTSEDKLEIGECYHNMGNAYLEKFQASSQDQEKAKTAPEELDKAIESYKKSLRHNPSDNETRYNLAIAQKIKKEGPPPQEQQQEQDQDKEKQDKEQEENEDQQQQEQDQQDQEEEQEQKQQPQPDKISKEDAEKILNAMMQEEKDLQEEQKEKQKAKMRSNQVEKDW